MYTHFRGSTFQFIGQLQDDGVPQDLTGCTLQANVYDPSGTTLYGNLVVNVFDAIHGLATVSFPDTSTWPVGKARIDFRFWNANNENIISPPDWFRIAESPMV